MSLVSVGNKVVNLRGLYYEGGKGIVINETDRKIKNDETVIFTSSHDSGETSAVCTENVTNFEFLRIKLWQGRNDDGQSTPVDQPNSRYEIIMRPDGMKHSYATYGGVGVYGWRHWVGTVLQASGNTVTVRCEADWLAYLDPAEIMCQEDPEAVGIVQITGVNRI